MNATRLFAALALGALLAGCATVPYTDRTQFTLLSESQETDLGSKSFQEIKEKEKISRDPAQNELLKRVGERIARVADKPEYEWEFVVVDDPKMVNAFALPGGKVAFYSGIFPITKDETGVAVVMSHEVAHALARHGNERISQQMAAGLTLDILLAGKSEQAKYWTQQAYGIGLALPFSRKQESEADAIGLILMAKAGYDPRTAIDFWGRMKSAKGGNAPPEFLSTHPSDETRIQKIREHLPEALRYYQPK